MSIFTCIRNAAATPEGEQPRWIDRLRDDINERAAKLRERGYSADAAELTATEQIAAEFKRRRGKAQEAVAHIKKQTDARRIIDDAVDAKGRPAPVEGLKQLSDQLSALSESNRVLFDSTLTWLIDKYRSRWDRLLFRTTKGQEDIVRARLEGGGSPEAQQFAQEIDTLYNTVRDAFRANGAFMPELENYLPMRHDADLLARGGRNGDGTVRKAVSESQARDEFIEWHLRDGVVDWDKVAESAGDTFDTAADRRDFLRRTFDKKVSDGMVQGEDPNVTAARDASKPYAQRFRSPRIMHYATADAFIEAHNRYASGPILNHILDDIESLATDLAVVQVLGPMDPLGAARQLGNYAAQRAGNEISNAAGKATGQFADGHWRRMVEIAVGVNHTAPASKTWRAAISVAEGARNLTSAALLTHASLRALPTDAMTTMRARKILEIPAARTWAAGMAGQFFRSSEARAAASRAGFAVEVGVREGMSQTRYTGDVPGRGWTRTFADRVHRATGLSGVTEAAQNMWRQDVWTGFGMHKDTPMRSLPDAWKDMFRRQGITARDWDAFRQTPAAEYDRVTMLRPKAVLERTDLSREEAWRLWQKFEGLTKVSSYMAVVQPTLRSRELTGGAIASGTLTGQWAAFQRMFLQFPASFYFNVFQPVVRDRFAKGYAGEAAASVAMLTLAGATGQFFVDLARGNNPANYDPTELEGLQNWGKAFMYGGGAGLPMDFLAPTMNNFGTKHPLVPGPASETIGGLYLPFINFISDKANERPTSFGVDVYHYARNLVPRPWQVSLLADRLLIEELDRAVDPQAQRRFSRSNVWREKNSTGSWWGKGRRAPSGPPDFAPMVAGEQ